LLVSRREKIALLGGKPIFDRPLNIVRPTFPKPETFIEQFGECLLSGQVTNNSRWAREFESQLSEYLNVPALSFCNGQIALLAMLWAFDIKDTEVIVPAFTFSATPHAVVWCGGTPVFADIKDDGSMCLDPQDVERKVTPRTKAILGVDPYGICCDYDELAKIARKHGLKLLFDSAPSFGSRVDGRLTGGFGDAQIFSFHATKAFATMEGGCVCSNDPEVIERVKAIRNFGLQPSSDCEDAGLNGKLTEICALIGIEQLKTFEASAAIRRKSVQTIKDGLKKLPGIKCGVAPSGQEPIWLYLPVIIDKLKFGIDRNQTAAAFERENFFVRKYYSPACHQLSIYRGATQEALPVSEYHADNVIALPVYNDMKPEECEGIVQLFFDVYESAPEISKLIGIS